MTDWIEAQAREIVSWYCGDDAEETKWGRGEQELVDRITAALTQAVARERERCATVAEDRAMRLRDQDMYSVMLKVDLHAVADAIRQPPEKES